MGVEGQAYERDGVENEHFRAVADIVTDAIIIANTSGTIEYANPAAARMFDYAPGELAGASLTVLVPERSRAAHQAGLTRFCASGEARVVGRTVELTGQRKDGGELPIELSLAAREVAGGYRFTAIIRDVSERHKLAGRLERDEAALAEAQAIAQVGSWDWDMRTQEVSWSDELYRIHGQQRGSVVPSYQAFSERIHPDDRERVNQIVQDALEHRKPFSFEYRLVRPDGQVRMLHGSGRMFLDEDGVPLRLAGTAQDITERRQVEQRLLISDRMASVGTLAAGVAHEINNPLAYVMGNLDLALTRLPTISLHLKSAHEPAVGAILRADASKLDEVITALEEAREGAMRVRDVVKGMKTFARPDDSLWETINVRDVIDSAVNMAWNEIRHRARLVRDYAELPTIQGSESRVGQVVLNLLINAAQAIPEGNVEAHEIRISARAERGRVIIEVSDDGSGIPADVLGRIFDPFFTTKAIGSGTGLGLSICHGIVMSMGGDIAVETRVGEGSVFRVSLPVGASPPRVSPAPLAPALTQRARILIIDDEPLITTYLRRLLGSAHEVVTVRGGRDALQCMLTGARFDVILCDLLMPEMTGMALYDQLRGSSPTDAERMIFMTGGAFTPRAQEFLERVPNPRIEKPIDMRQLLELIDKRLG